MIDSLFYWFEELIVLILYGDYNTFFSAKVIYLYWLGSLFVYLSWNEGSHIDILFPSRG